MYPSAFHYHRASSLAEAVSILSELGDDAKVIAGGQSLIPLLKLRLATPEHLIDLGFITELSFIQAEQERVSIGALAKHAQIESSSVAKSVPIVGDCSSGIADHQVRNRGTIGGSLAEADPAGDWAPVMLVLDSEITCVSPKGERTLRLTDFIVDAYATDLEEDELVSQVSFAAPSSRSGGAFFAFKRSSQVYASASAAVQMTLEEDGSCKDARIAMGCVGLTTIQALEAANELRGKALNEDVMARAAEAAASEADPQGDMRGSEAYKRFLVGNLVKQAIKVAVRRCQGEQVKVSHYYA